MSAVLRGVYVLVGALDLAAERLLAIPALERAMRVSLLDQLREIEPRLRQGSEQLQTRGEHLVSSVRSRIPTAKAS